MRLPAHDVNDALRHKARTQDVSKVVHLGAIQGPNQKETLGPFAAPAAKGW